jgi:hypothetical protein
MRDGSLRSVERLRSQRPLIGGGGDSLKIETALSGSVWAITTMLRQDSAPDRFFALAIVALAFEQSAASL